MTDSLPAPQKSKLRLAVEAALNQLIKGVGEDLAVASGVAAWSFLGKPVIGFIWKWFVSAVLTQVAEIVTTQVDNELIVVEKKIEQATCDRAITEFKKIVVNQNSGATEAQKQAAIDAAKKAIDAIVQQGVITVKAHRFELLKAFLVAFTLVSCASCKLVDVKIPVAVHDVEVCGDLGPIGAHCAHSLKTDVRDIPKDTWDDYRIGLLCMSSSDFTSLMITQEQLCNDLKVCDYKEQAAVMKVMKRMTSLAKASRDAKHKHNLMLQQMGLTPRSLPPLHPALQDDGLGDENATP